MNIRNAMMQALEEFQIGKETNVVTNDNDDVTADCDEAHTVCSISVRFVQVFSCKLAERNQPAIHTIN